jgi:LacI family transcriptional regulator
LATDLGLSVGTVSQALRDSEKVRPSTRERVLAAARRAGYHANPAVGLVMSAMRRGLRDNYRGTLAILNAIEPPNAGRASFHRAVLDGATARAKTFGYNVEVFHVGPGALTLRRVNSVLRSRNVQGVIVMPFETPQDWSELAWDRFSAVRMFNPLSEPLLHTVCPDHHQLLLHGLEHLDRCGWQRIGLFLRRGSEARIRFKWSAAFHVYQQQQKPAQRIPPLLLDHFEAAPFLAWFKRHRPRVVMGHTAQAIDWLASCGIRVPEDVGFINLNVTQEIRPCAGLNLRPDLLGGTAADHVIAQINRNERGIPAHAHTTQIEGHWVDGPTLLAQPPPAPRSRAPSRT